MEAEMTDYAHERCIVAGIRRRVHLWQTLGSFASRAGRLRDSPKPTGGNGYELQLRPEISLWRILAMR